MKSRMGKDFIITDQTEEFNNRINAIRRMPQGKDKQLEAVLFRTDVMLDNARIFQFIFENAYKTTRSCRRMDENINDFKRQIKEKVRYMAHPDEAIVFLNDLIAKMFAVKNTLDNTNGISATDIYEMLSGKKPKKIVILDTTRIFPCLRVTNKKDFDRLAPYSLGFSRDVNFKIPHISDFSYPIIVMNEERIGEIGDIKYADIYKHETAHAEHNMIRDLSRVISRQIWISPDHTVKEAQDRLYQKIDIYEDDGLIGEEEVIKECKLLLFQVLELAKDEILAGFSSNDDIEERRRVILTKGFIYDYIQNFLNIMPQIAILKFYFFIKMKPSRLYKILWDEYETVLKEQTDPVFEILKTYYILRLNKRIQLFRLVLAQIPFYKWKEQMERSGFWIEIQKIKECLDLGISIDELSSELKDEQDKCFVRKLEEIIKGKKK